LVATAPSHEALSIAGTAAITKENFIANRSARFGAGGGRYFDAPELKPG